jgi:hypothetical protein
VDLFPDSFPARPRREREPEDLLASASRKTSSSERRQRGIETSKSFTSFS